MELKTIKSYARVDAPVITSFEQSYPIRLPDDYKSFITENRGTQPIGAYWFECKGDDVYVAKQGEKVYLDSIYNVGEDIPQVKSIAWNRKCKEEYLPTCFFPIADTGLGDVVCINLKKGKSYGCIYYVIHDAYHDEDDVNWDANNINKTGCNDMNGVYFLAKSFSDFIDLLQNN